MICDYLIKQTLELEKLETKFNNSWELVGTFYNIKYETEFQKLAVLMKIHEYFMSTLVKKGSAKPVVTVRDVSFW